MIQTCGFAGCRMLSEPQSTQCSLPILPRNQARCALQGLAVDITRDPRELWSSEKQLQSPSEQPPSTQQPASFRQEHNPWDAQAIASLSKPSSEPIIDRPPPEPGSTLSAPEQSKPLPAPLHIPAAGNLSDSPEPLSYYSSDSASPLPQAEPLPPLPMPNTDRNIESAGTKAPKYNFGAYQLTKSAAVPSTHIS